MPLPCYLIQVNGKYFAGQGEKVVGVTGQRNAWYSAAKDRLELLFTEDKDKAKIAEGNSNLNSYIKMIFEHNRDKLIQFDEVTIKKVGEI